MADDSWHNRKDVGGLISSDLNVKISAGNAWARLRPPLNGHPPLELCVYVLRREAQQSTDDDSKQHRENSRRPEPQRDGTNGKPSGAGIDDQVLAPGERAGNDERGDQSWGHQGDNPSKWRR